MANEVVYTGTNANDGTGDTLRSAMTLINAAFVAEQNTRSSRDLEIEGQVASVAASFTIRTWAAGQSYGPGTIGSLTAKRDVVLVSGVWYVAAVEHVAGASFATDLAAGKWLTTDPVQLRGDLADTGIGKGAQMIGGNEIAFGSYAAMKAYTGPRTAFRINVPGIAGQFETVPGDTTTAEDGGIWFVRGDGVRVRRVYSGPIDVRWFGAVPGRIVDATPAFQAAVNAMPLYSTLKADGDYLFSTHVNFKKSHVVYDFSAADFNMTGAGGTAYGAGVLIGDSDNPATIPVDVTLLGGVYRPSGNSTVFPLADYNPIAILCGKNITVRNPTVYAVNSVRALSIQTDNAAGTGSGPNIDGVSVTGLTVYGDGSAADGVDIGYVGAPGLIRNVSVQGKVYGCKSGVHTYTSNPTTDPLVGLTLDLEIDGASEWAGYLGAADSADIKIRARSVTKLGFDIVQFINSQVDLSVQGYGAGLTDAVIFRQTAAGSLGNSVSATISTIDGNKWARGLVPQSDFAAYPRVNIEDAVVGISVSGFRSSFGNVTFRNCTTEIDYPSSLNDAWGDVVSFGNGSNPIVPRRTFNSSAGAALYGIDLHNQLALTLAPGGTAKVFGENAEFSGMLLVNGIAGTGGPALFVMGEGLTYLVGGASAVYSAASGTASRVNVYYDGSFYPTIQNNTASSVTLRVFSIRMRNSA